jgi:hypothetical protein
MSVVLEQKITKALDTLEESIRRATEAVAECCDTDERLTDRMNAYGEVVRRQRALAADLSKALARRDLREVSRLAHLLQGSSLMVKMDLEHILSSIKFLREQAFRSAA